MDAPFKENATYADLETIPETWVGEIIHGDLYAFPHPGSLHARALTRLIQMLGPFDDDGWIILHSVEIWFGDNLLVPDLAGWRRSRMSTLPDVQTLDLAPDWVCEALAPDTVLLDKGPKREIYAKSGVGQLWFADPALHTIDVFTLTGTSYTFERCAANSQKAKLAPFPQPIDLSRLWQR